MAACRRVDDLSHLRTDYLYTGISSRPNAQYEYGKPLPYFTLRFYLRPFFLFY